MDISTGKKLPPALVWQEAESSAPPVHACPECHAQMPVDSLLCLACGFNLRTGEKRAPHQPGDKVPPSAQGLFERTAQAEKVITFKDILKTPWSKGLYGDAALIMVGNLLWAALFYGLLYLPLLGLAAAGQGALATMIAIAVLAAYLSWLFSKYIGVVQEYYMGGMAPETTYSRLMCLGMGMVVSLVSSIPLVVFSLLGAVLFLIAWVVGGTWATTLPVGAFVIVAAIVSGVWAVVYAPMGFAVAGAYGTVHPGRVLRNIARLHGKYVGVLLYALLCAVIVAVVDAAAMAVVTLLSILVGQALERLFVLQLYIAIGFFGILMIGLFVLACLEQYVVAATLAMVAMLLRKYPEPGAPRAVGQDLPRPGAG